MSEAVPKMLLMIVTAVLSVALLAGCATRPTEQEFEQANYGPMPENYQAAVTASILTRLKDPESARITFDGPPRHGFMGAYQRFYGWVVCGTVNAKNSYGGYAGAMPFSAMMFMGSVVTFRMGDAQLCS